MTRNQRNKTLDLAAAALALSLLLPHSAAAQRHYVSGKTKAVVQQKAPAAPQKTGPCADPSQCLAVDFDKAPLSEVVYLVSEMTGEGFVFDEDAKTPAVSWSQQDVQKSQLLPTFIKVLTSLGMTVHRIEDSNFWAIRSEPSLVSGADKFSSGVYHLKYLDADAVQKSADTLYGKRLSAFGAKGSKVIAFSGDPGLVADFSRTLADIDQPPQTDSGIASIKLRHISVRTAVSALNDLKIFVKSGSSSAKGEKSSSGSQPSGGIFPDYWNRSVIVSGTKNQQDMALLALSAIDKPQEGHADEVVFLNVLTADDALTALKELYEALSFRKLSPERLLISGDRPLVDEALATVSKMDGAGLQVKVEAVLASLTDKEFLELGTSLATSRSELDTSLNSSFIKVFPTPYSGALLKYFDEVLSVKFAAGEGFSKGEVISSPVLTVLNGQEANLVVGQSVPFLTQKEKSSKKDSDGDETTSALSVERKDVGLAFKIKPVIRPDGDFIRLTVSQELSSVNPESQLKNAADLIVDKKSVATTVLVGNGDLIFLGGLRYQEAGKSVEMVPLLGDIPLLGQLFTYKSEVAHARNLIISLRVNVVSAPEKGEMITFSAEKG